MLQTLSSLDLLRADQLAEAARRAAAGYRQVDLARHFEVTQPRVSEAFRDKNTELALRILALFGQPYAGPFYVSLFLIGRSR